jgi:hypothetical protein
MLASSARLLPLLDLTVEGGVGGVGRFARAGSLLLVGVPIAFAAVAFISLVVEFDAAADAADGVDCRAGAGSLADLVDLVDLDEEDGMDRLWVSD